MSGLGECFFQVYSFPVIEIQDLGFDYDFCFTFLYLVAAFFQGSLDYICSDTCLFSSSWKRGSGTSEQLCTSEIEDGRKLYDWRERGKGVSFPHMRRKTKLRPGNWAF